MHDPTQPRSTGSGHWVHRAVTALRPVGWGAHLVLLAAAIGVVLYFTVPFARQVSLPKPPEWPSTMEQVDWTSPDSSKYCIACHRQVSPAMVGLDVEQGHPQNVALSAAQLQAIADLGTIVGPDNTLICMSCHKLGQPVDQKYMLADTLADSRLCRHCHAAEFTSESTPHDLRVSAPQEHNRLDQSVTDAGPCSACHLSHRFARAFEPSPTDPDGRCVTCHQEFHIAAKRARARMDHPESHCVQCHNPHTLAFGEFLKQPVSDLCVGCHDELGGGVAKGMHPLGPMPYDLPKELVEAGAEPGSDPRELTCLSCHSTHQADFPKLLVLEETSNRLCLACHEEKLAERTHERILPKHGQGPLMNQNQVAIVTAWAGKTGPEGELRCVSCHRVHGGEPAEALLAFKPLYGETCLACHPQQTTVLGTPHDLRSNFPEEKNVKGMTPLSAGSCSACHLAHGFGRDFASTAADPSGQCITCHEPGKCGEKKLVGGVDHPDTKCIDCHDPHMRQQPKFLAQGESELCVRCHTSQALIAGGPHDPAAKPEAWQKLTTVTGTCLPCHAPHGGDRPDLFRVGGQALVGNHDEVCLACHAAAGWKAESNIAALHPQQINPAEKKVDLALVPTDAAGNLRMGCRTCHNPHGGADPVHLARVEPGEATETLCLHCHEQKQYVQYTGHASRSLEKLGYDSDSCKPCHAMHAPPDDTWGTVLSPRFLTENCERLADAGVGCVPCLACHHAGGPAPVRSTATHPEVPMTNFAAPEGPGNLPLYAPDGKEDPRGQVVCRTCHVSHGRIDLFRYLAENRAPTAEEQHALKIQVRPFTPPNVCTSCHGADGRVMYLFFHTPERRQGVGKPTETVERAP